MNRNRKVVAIKNRADNDDLQRGTNYRAYTPKTKKKKFKIVSFIFVISILYFARTAFNQYQMIKVLDCQIADKSTEKSVVEKKVNELKTDVANFKDEEVLLEVVEKIARNEYRMVKPNETIYIDKDKNNNKFITGIGFEADSQPESDTENKKN